MPFNSKSNKASSPLVKIQDVPDIPTIGTAVEGAEEALVAFTPASTGGRAYQYRALSTPDGIEAVGTASPILVPGLTAGTSYTFQVRGETNLGATTGYSSASNAVVPFQPSAYDLLETQVLSSDAASITFTSLNSTYGSTYKHLQIRGVAKTNRNEGSGLFATLQYRFNSDSGTNYAGHALSGNGTSVSSGAGTSLTQLEVPTAGFQAVEYSAFVIDILDAFSTSKNTTVRALAGRTQSALIQLVSGLWINTAAVDSISFFDSAATNIESNTRISIYGVK